MPPDITLESDDTNAYLSIFYFPATKSIVVIRDQIFNQLDAYLYQGKEQFDILNEILNGLLEDGYTIKQPFDYQEETIDVKKFFKL